VIFAFSFAVELIQYAIAIGVADITDLIMNTLGGFIGLAAYAAARGGTNNKRLDRGILLVGALILLTILYLRIFVFIVKY
jgi:glycopeptide antibiotics resistance protein